VTRAPDGIEAHAHQAGGVRRYPHRADDTALIAFTSGTTGKPKDDDFTATSSPRAIAAAFDAARQRR
jgi:acyl-coenzyme A synthetase/AMP-(fatty) acid ligase